MAYTPTNWQTGDKVTAAKLNKLENGLAEASEGTGGASFLIVHSVEDTLDKTAGEIYAAMQTGLVIVVDGSHVDVLSSAYIESGEYYFYAGINYTEYTAGGENSYPALEIEYFE